MLIDTLNLRFPTLLKVALSLPLRMSYGRTESALMIDCDGFFCSLSFDVADCSSLLSLDAVLYASLLRGYSSCCCLIEIFRKDDSPRSISFCMHCWSSVDIAILIVSGIHNITACLLCISPN